MIKKFRFSKKPYIISLSGEESDNVLINDNDDKNEGTDRETEKEDKILNDIFKKAYQDGKKQGIEEGEKKGLENGYKKGFDEGVEKGFHKGQQEGLKKGYDEGLKKGYDEGLKKGYDEGLKKGYDEGLKKGKGEFEKIILSFQNSIKKLNTQKESLISELESKILNFTFQFAETVTKREVRKGDSLVINILKEALNHIVLDKNIMIKVSLSDVELVEEYISKNIPLLEGDVNINVIGDENLSKGSVNILTSSASVDARIDEMIHRLQKALLE